MVTTAHIQQVKREKVEDDIFFAGRRAGSITSKFTLCSRVAGNTEERM